MSLWNRLREMNREEFVKEWNEKMNEIQREYIHPSQHYIRVENYGKGHIYAQEYLFAYEDFVLFAVRIYGRVVYTGGEYLKNVKRLK